MNKAVSYIIAGIIIALTLALMLVMSWGVIAFFVWLITLCFGWEFSVLSATGIWLIVIFAARVYNIIFK